MIVRRKLNCQFSCHSDIDYDVIVHFFCLVEHIKQVANLLKEVEFIFVPFVNPDGYEVMMT